MLPSAAFLPPSPPRTVLSHCFLSCCCPQFLFSPPDQPVLSVARIMDIQKVGAWHAAHLAVRRCSLPPSSRLLINITSMAPMAHMQKGDGQAEILVRFFCLPEETYLGRQVGGGAVVSSMACSLCLRHRHERACEPCVRVTLSHASLSALGAWGIVLLCALYAPPWQPMPSQQLQ